MHQHPDPPTAPPSGTRAPQARRDAIVAAAAELLIEPGGPSFTHRAVAQRAGVSLGSTTRYFTSIDQLRTEALACLSAEMEASLAAIAQVFTPASPASTTADGLALAIDLMHEFVADQRYARATLAMMAAAASQPDLATMAAAWSHQLTAILARHIGGEAARAVVMFLDGASAHAALSGTSLTRDEVARVVTALAQELT